MTKNYVKVSLKKKFEIMSVDTSINYLVHVSVLTVHSYFKQSVQ